MFIQLRLISIPKNRIKQSEQYELVSPAGKKISQKADKQNKVKKQKIIKKQNKVKKQRKEQSQNNSGIQIVSNQGKIQMIIKIQNQEQNIPKFNVDKNRPNWNQFKLSYQKLSLKSIVSRHTYCFGQKITQSCSIQIKKISGGCFFGSGTDRPVDKPEIFSPQKSMIINCTPGNFRYPNSYNCVPIDDGFIIKITINLEVFTIQWQINSEIIQILEFKQEMKNRPIYPIVAMNQAGNGVTQDMIQFL